VDSRKKSNPTIDLPDYYKHAEETIIPWDLFAERKLGKYLIVSKKVADLKINEITLPHKGGTFRGTSVGRDKNGYFVCTHRARSKSYPDVHKIPKSVIAWIESTG